MPLVYQQNINESTRLGVWHIEEDESFFLGRVPLGRSITHPRKRLQHLAGRLLLSELFPAFPVDLIRIADTRRPFLDDDVFHFSISHGGDYAAALVSTTQRVGVDIEIPHNKIEKLSGKFLSPEEKNLIGAWQVDNVRQLTLAWSIKESLFKWYGRSEMDFRKHLQILNTGHEGEWFTADCIVSKHEARELTVRGRLLHGYVLTYVVS